jgi:hypothetical protein
MPPAPYGCSYLPCTRARLASGTAGRAPSRRAVLPPHPARYIRALTCAGTSQVQIGPSEVHRTSCGNKTSWGNKLQGFTEDVGPGQV